MKNKVLSLLKACSIKDIAILSSGMIVAQMIGMVAQPIATRFYSPENFGVFNLIQSLTAMFTPIMVMQYDYCIVSAKDDKEANSVTALSAYILIAFAILFGIGIFIFNLFSPNTFKLAGGWIYFAAFFLMCSGIVSIVENYNNRFGQFKLMSTMSIYRAAVSNTAKISLGALKAGYVGLIVSQILSSVFGIKRQARYIIKQRKEIFGTKLSELKRVALKYKNQPLFSAPGLFVVGYAYSAIPFYINSLYGTTNVGYYSLAVSMLGLPLNLVSASVGKVFFRNASREMAETGGFSKTFNSTFLLLVSLVIIPFIILFFVAEPLFGFVFGSEWVTSGTYVKCLIPLYFANFIANTLIVALIICGAQRTKLIMQSFFLVFSLAAYFVTKEFSLPIETFLVISSVGYAIIYFAMIWLIYKKSKA